MYQIASGPNRNGSEKDHVMADSALTTHCRVAELAYQAQKEIGAHEVLEARWLDRDCPDKDAAHAKVRQAFNHILMLGEAASCLEAKSADGAIYQLHILCDGLESMKSLVPHGTQEWTEARMLHEQMRRLIYSVHSFIETSAEVDASKVCADFYMSPALNPHAAGMVS